MPSLRRQFATAVASSSSTASYPFVPESRSPHAKPGRVYTDRKTFLYTHYAQLLTSSDLVLLFQHANLSTAETLALRRAITSVPTPEGAENKALLTVTRTGILSALSRDVQSPEVSLRPMLSGPTALLTTSSLSPRYLSQLLAALNKTMNRIVKNKEASNPPDKARVAAGLPPVGVPTMKLVAGVVEKNRLLGLQQIGDVAKLPEMDQLRAQLVGLLQSQQSSLVGVLAQAGGGGLLRTLQGLEAGLKAKEPAAEQV